MGQLHSLSKSRRVQKTTLQSVLVVQTVEDDDDYYLWDEGGRPCVPAPGARLDEAVQDVLCVPEWQEEGIPTRSKKGETYRWNSQLNLDSDHLQLSDLKLCNMLFDKES